MKQAFTLPKFTDQANKQPLAKVAVRSLLVCISLWLLPTVAKADTPIPTQVITSYNAGLQRLTVNVNWFWTTTSSSKHVGVAVFADLNGDGIIPTVYDNPATYNSGGNPFPAGLLPRDEFLGQIALSNIEGSATSAMFPGIVDNTDNGIASTVPGVTPSTPRMLLPYGTNGQDIVNASGNDNGSFTVTYNGVPVSPTQICVILYDPHSPFKATGGHSVVSAGPDHNTDNSLEEGNAAGTVSCTTLTTLNCAQNKTEAACQTQAAINASYNAWLNSVTASGCNGTLTNNSSGAPSACGGSKTVTWTYTQNSCANQAPVSTCTATFTVTADASAPTFTSCPSGANLGCNPSGVPPAGTPTVTDNCGSSNVTITHSLGAVSSNGNQRTQTRTYVATDACGNSATCQQVFTWTVCASGPVYNHDFNVTYVNVSVTGDVKTNDVVPSGTSYGTPTLIGSPAGSTQTITMNSSGTYTFVANTPGVYTYNVPVCVPGAVSPCPTTTLTITVLEPTINNNPPVANPDIAFTKVNTAVLIKTLENDKAGNPGGSLNPASVTITVSALNGSSSINTATGDNTYTPNAGFTGWDVLTYQVCDNNVPAMCATAKQYIFVSASNAPNTTFADDDYAYTQVNTSVSGNVKTNDTDPEGHFQNVTAQNTTIAGKGTLVLNSNGTFTFTPVSGFTGPVNFPYTTCDNGSPQACASATLYVLVSPPLTMYNHDFNVTYVNVPVPGNVRLNDVVPAGTTYGTPALNSSPAGSTQTITMNTNGTYTFVANKPGVYVYTVPVCIPGAVSPCPTTTLTITVLDPVVNNNPPVANPDIAVTKVNTPVLIYTLINDKAGNPGGSLNPASVSITVAAMNGSSSINPATGNNTYTPNPGFTGWDVLTYQVCDNSVPALCATSKQYIYVQANNSVNTTFAADDYAYTHMNVAVSGNVKTNDTDPEGHTQLVTSQNTTIPGKGTLALDASGAFTFTPVAGFTGPVNFAYTTCDNGTPQACASATLYILVSPPASLYNPDFNVTYVNVTVPGNVRTNDIVPAGTTYGTPTLVSSPGGSTQTVVMNPNGTYTFVANTPGVYTYNVPVCVPGAVAPCPTSLLTITVLAPNTNNNPPVANTDIAFTKVGVPVLIKTLANDKAGNPGGTLNPASVTVTVAAANGTSSINAATGDNTYTPNPGFTGWDVLTYRVCDNSTPTPLCATAQQYIYVYPNAVPNTTLADDDYAYTNMNVAVTGNVKTNDTDPEGNTQTVTAQTTTVPGKGTLVLAADGSYTFTPVNGFTGPVNFVYTTCDNGVPSACASATLYVMVAPLNTPDFTPTHDIDALTFAGQTTQRDMIININEVLNGHSVGQVQFKVRKVSAFTMTYNPTATTANVFGGTAVNNSDWLFTEDANFITVTLKPGVVIPPYGVSRIGFTLTRNPGVPVNTTQNITTTIVTGSGGDTNSANNQAVTSITAN